MAWNGFDLFTILQLYNGDEFFIDPLASEVQNFDLTDQQSNDKGGGFLTMGYIPTTDQICLFTMEGKMPPNVFISAMDTLITNCSKIYSVVRTKFVKSLESDSWKILTSD